MNPKPTTQPQKKPARHSFDLDLLNRDISLDKEAQLHIQKLSQDLLVQIYTLMRMLIFHSRDNDATQKVLTRLYDVLQQLFQTEYEIHIEYTGSDFIINERWLRLPRQLHDLTEKFGEQLKSRGIGGIWISAVPQPQEFLKFIRELHRVNPEEVDDPFSKIQNYLWHHKLDWLTLERYVEFFDWEGTGLDLRSYIRQIYFCAIQSVQQLYVQAQQEKPLKIKTLKRSTQAFVELFTSPRRQDEAEFLLMLTNVKNCLGYEYCHATNTAIISVAFAHYLGFPRSVLRDIGIAAMLFNIGMIKLPPELEFAKDLPPEQQQLYESHPIQAIPIILNTSFIDGGVMRAVSTAFTHHLGPKGTGFPKVGQTIQSPISKLISLVDQYMALTSPHPLRTKLLTPTQALAELTLTIDPVLIRQFIGYMGVLPIGSVIQLNNRDIAYVIKHPAPEKEPYRPIVKLIHSKRGKGLHLDLSKTNANGQHPYYIVNILDIGDPRLQQIILEDLLL